MLQWHRLYRTELCLISRLQHGAPVRDSTTTTSTSSQDRTGTEVSSGGEVASNKPTVRKKASGLYFPKHLAGELPLLKYFIKDSSSSDSQPSRKDSSPGKFDSSGVEHAAPKLEVQPTDNIKSPAASPTTACTGNPLATPLILRCKNVTPLIRDHHNDKAPAGDSQKDRNGTIKPSVGVGKKHQCPPPIRKCFPVVNFRFVRVTTPQIRSGPIDEERVEEQPRLQPMESANDPQSVIRKRAVRITQLSIGDIYKSREHKPSVPDTKQSVAAPLVRCVISTPALPRKIPIVSFGFGPAGRQARRRRLRELAQRHPAHLSRTLLKDRLRDPKITRKLTRDRVRIIKYGSSFKIRKLVGRWRGAQRKVNVLGSHWPMKFDRTSIPPHESKALHEDLDEVLDIYQTQHPYRWRET